MLGLGVLAVSSAAVIVSALEGTDPVTLAAWRTAIVAALLAPWVRRTNLRDLAWIALSGACLAAHFVTWFASLHQTSVLRSTVLVCLGPVWLGLAEWGLLRRAPGLRYWGGVALALPAVAALSATGSDPGTLSGDLLALLGGLLGAAYLLIGREVRPRVAIGTYASLVCAAAAVWLFPFGWITGVALIPTTPWIWAGILALALGPQLLGHNSFNYALRYLPASTVSMATLLEPIGATVLAFFVLSQVPGPIALVAGAFVCAGVLLAASARRTKKAET